MCFYPFLFNLIGFQVISKKWNNSFQAELEKPGKLVIQEIQEKSKEKIGKILEKSRN